MSTLALPAQLLPLLGWSAAALGTDANDGTPIVSSGQVHPPVGHRMANLPAFAELGVLMAVAAGGYQKLETFAGQCVPTVAAVVDFGARVLSAAIAHAIGTVEHLAANRCPSRACQVLGVGRVAHAGQENISLLIRRELFAHGGDLAWKDCAAALVASVVTTITVGIRSQ